MLLYPCPGETLVEVTLRVIVGVGVMVAVGSVLGGVGFVII